MNLTRREERLFAPGEIIEPIINPPYGDPDRHYIVNADTKAIGIRSGRRPSENMPPVAGSKAGGRRRLRADADLGRSWGRLELVNELRERVADWREAGYPGVTFRTRELIRYWTEGGEDGEIGAKLYFAQLDAALTHIYLKEVDDGEIGDKIAAINEERNNGVDRVCHKMATGSGKTLVMAMLVVWQTANNAAYPDDPRFTSRFLFLAPGITVRERLLAALMPSAADSDYENFYLLPPGDFWEGVLSRAAVYVVNVHQLDLKSALIKPSSTASAVLNGGANPLTEEEIAAQRESVEEMIARVAGAADERILVFNDESHHCHRGDPNKYPEDTKWFSGLQAIRDRGLLLYATDMSATPTYIKQSNPEPVEWIVSDYSLLDAIEAGLVKIPRVPTREERVRGPDNQSPRFRDIFDRTPAKERNNFDPAKADNNRLLKEAFGALYADYEAHDKRWRELERGKPPVMAIVMNTVANANRMFSYIADNMADAPLLANVEGETPRVIIVHSKIEEGGSAPGEIGRHVREIAELFGARREYAFQPSDKPDDIIRRVMNTVGKVGQPGEGVRCVISVDMLTEGWDAQTVTHMLGFRKFASSLLCEQVAGRTLRRVDRSQDGRGMFSAEYAQILGVPFPQYVEPSGESDAGDVRNMVSVEPRVDSHINRRLHWPNIVGYNRRANPYGVISVAPKAVADEAFRIALTRSTPTVLEPVAGESTVVGGGAVIAGRQRSLYVIAAEAQREILVRIADQVGADDGDLKDSVRHASLFAQILGAVRGYVASGALLPETGADGAERWPGQGDSSAVSAAGKWLAGNLEILQTNGVDADDPAARIQMIPVSSKSRHWRHTGELRPYVKTMSFERMYGEADKAEINYADCDSGWERDAAEALDAMPEISRWARNHRLGWSIPYVDGGETKRYLPDFVAAVPLEGGKELRLVIEVKGEVRPGDETKRRWAESYWIPGVNASREFSEAGRIEWAYLYIGEREYAIGPDEAIREFIDARLDGRRPLAA